MAKKTLAQTKAAGTCRKGLPSTSHKYTQNVPLESRTNQYKIQLTGYVWQEFYMTKKNIMILSYLCTEHHFHHSTPLTSFVCKLARVPTMASYEFCEISNMMPWFRGNKRSKYTLHCACAAYIGTSIFDFSFQDDNNWYFFFAVLLYWFCCLWEVKITWIS